MPNAITNNALNTNPLLGYGYGAGQGTGAAPASQQRAVSSPAMQAFGGYSGFQPAVAQSAVGGAQGGLSPDLVQSLQGLVSALTQVVQQLASLIQSMGGAQAQGQGAGAGGGNNAAVGTGTGLGGGNAGIGTGGGAYSGGGAHGGGNNAAVGTGTGTGGGNAAIGNGGGAYSGGGAQGGGNGGVGPIGGGGQAAQALNPNFDYKTLSTQERTQVSGMTPEQRAALHLWGIQMGSAGKQDGGVYLNVLQNPQAFQPAEVALVQKLAAQEMAQFGGYTGKALDQAFFGVYGQLTGKDVSQRYAGAPINFAQGPVNMANRQTGQNGLSNFENSVMQLWGHNPLFTGGKIDGSILDYSLNSPNVLEANLNRNDVLALRDMDLASDGVLNGDSLEKNFIEVMDKVYMGDAGASVQGGMNAALEEAAARREGLLPPPAPEAQAISPQQVEAMANAIKQGKGASACPFLSGGGGVQGA
jgi:hypothetical protein